MILMHKESGDLILLRYNGESDIGITMDSWCRIRSGYLLNNITDFEIIGFL